MTMSQKTALVAISDWPSQLQALKLLFNEDEIAVKYRDEEGDEIGINGQKDYDYALELARSQFSSSLGLVIRDGRGGLQKLAETRLRVEARADESPKERKMSQAAVQTALTPERHTNATQTSAGAPNEDPVALMLESQLVKFKSEIASEIESKLSMFMSQLRRSSSQSPALVSLDSEHDFEVTQLGDESELASRVSKMLKIRSEAEAIGRRLKLAYFEEELELSGAFNSEFIKDCNVPDGTQLQPHVKFEKMWMLKNTGKLEWNQQTFPVKLVCVSGNLFVLNDNHVDVKQTAHDEIATVSVNLMTPSRPGSYFSEWRLSCNGYQFGPKIWCSIEVVEATDSPKTDELTTSHKLTMSTASASFNNSTDSFEEVNTSSFQEGDEKSLEQDDILVVPDCFDLGKEWKRKQQKRQQQERRDTQGSSSSNSNGTQSECNIEIFEEGLESRNDQTSTHADTSLNSSFCQGELDNTLGKDRDGDGDEEATVVVVAEQPKTAESSSPTRKSLDDEMELIAKNVSGTIDLMKNAFKNLSGPSYVGYVVSDLENKENTTPSSSTSTSSRDELLKRVAHNYDSAPAVVVKSKQELTSMQKLVQMGYANRALNERLLRAHNDDIQKVVHHLTQRSDNWSH